MFSPSSPFLQKEELKPLLADVKGVAEGVAWTDWYSMKSCITAKRCAGVAEGVVWVRVCASVNDNGQQTTT